MRILLGPAVAVVLGFVSLAAGPADATQAYGSDGWSVLRTGAGRSDIKACSTSGRTTVVTAVGGPRFSVDDVRIIPGTQSQLDNVITASRFIRTRAATRAGRRITSCRVVTSDGTRRMIVTTAGGARWALVRPRVGSYFMSVAAEM